MDINRIFNIQTKYDVKKIVTYFHTAVAKQFVTTTKIQYTITMGGEKEGKKKHLQNFGHGDKET